MTSWNKTGCVMGAVEKDLKPLSVSKTDASLEGQKNNENNENNNIINFCLQRLSAV